MDKTKTYQFKGRIYSEIPETVVKKLDIKAGDELLFEIGKDVVLKTIKGNSFLNTEEKVALSKLNDIRHAERTQRRVDAEFKSDLINKMTDKKILFKYSKNGKSMVGVDRKYSSFKLNSGMLGELEVYGFLVIENPKRVKALEYALQSSKRTGEVIGVRGFDKKFYVMLKTKLNKYRKEILKNLNKETSIFELSKKLKISTAFCKTALEILKEQGEVIEKEESTFKKV